MSYICMAYMGKQQETYFYNISHRIPVDLSEKIHKFQHTAQIPERTKAINKLLELALIVWERGSELKRNPTMLDELHDQLVHSGAVEFVKSLNPKEIEVLYSILRTEYKSRFKKDLPDA